MKDFTLGLALLDYVPVIAFGLAVIILATGIGSPLFITGAALSLIAGLMKATWKLIIALKKKNIAWLNKPFMPIQSAGFLLMLIALIVNFKSISFSRCLELPQFIFFILWLILIGVMVWFKKTRFKMDDAKTNLTAEIINTFAQLALLTAAIFTVLVH